MNRLGDPTRMRNRDRIPRRSASRPRPYKRATARRLVRLALGIPNRKGRRPTKAVRRRAGRTLRLRALTRLWAARRIPGWLSRWYWDRIWAKIPQPPAPLTHHTIPTTPKAQPGPKHYPTQPQKVVPAMTAPHEIVTEAFNQLAQFTPQSATEMATFLQHHHEMFAEISRAYVTLADRMQTEMPYGQATPDSMRDLGAAFDGLSGVAEQVHATFRTEHAEKLANLETPAPGAQQWDITQQ